jgi:predicted nucleic acid-binding Zn ribbon protein
MFFSMVDLPTSVICPCGGSLIQKIAGGVGLVFKGESFPCNEYGCRDTRDRFEVGRKVKKARELKQSGKVPMSETLHVDDERLKQ